MAQPPLPTAALVRSRGESREGSQSLRGIVEVPEEHAARAGKPGERWMAQSLRERRPVDSDEAPGLCAPEVGSVGGISSLSI